MEFISPGGSGPKGLWHASYLHLNQGVLVINSHKPLHLSPFLSMPPLSYAFCLVCEEINLGVMFSKCSASHLWRLKRGLLVKDAKCCSPTPRRLRSSFEGSEMV